MPDTPSPYVPLRISCRIRAPIVTPVMLSLDGPLLAARYEQEFGFEEVTRVGVTPRGDLSIPIRKQHRGDENWYYQCSFAVWPAPIATAIAWWNKRLDTCDAISFLDSGRPKINAGEGRFRPLHMPMEIRHARALTWYCRGIPDEIRALLARLDGLGHKRAYGWGRVDDWIVEPWHADWSVRNDRDELMRTIPLDEAKPGDARGTGALHSPYWRPDHQIVCAVPRVDALLRKE